ncbi:MAG: hypothetical protein ACK4YP_27305, partial [Myxococcota bacterium]
PRRGPRFAVEGAVAALVAAVLATLATRHPGLRFVDLIGFSTRARHLGERLVDPLYPVGYPAVLAAARALGLDVLVAAKALAVAAGAGAAFAAGVLVGPGGAAWMAAQAGALAWGITEGTDLPAAALALGGIAAANARRPGLAGLLVGLACMVRYTAIAAVPVVLALAPSSWRTLLVAVAPHFVLAALTGASPIPDQSMNLEIGAGRPTPLFSLDTLLRWPGGFARALRDALPDGPTAVSAVGLLVGLRDRRARALLAWALLHCAAVALAFSNQRLVLPAQLAFALGAVWLVPARFRGLLAVAALPLLAWNAHLLWSPERRHAELATVAEAAAAYDGPFLSNSPWFYVRRDGWVVGSTQLSGLGDPRGLTPERLADRLRAT